MILGLDEIIRELVPKDGLTSEGIEKYLREGIGPTIVIEVKEPEKPIWYDGIEKDLRIVSWLDEQLSKEEIESRPAALERLNKNKKFPKLSQNPEDKREDLNRQRVRAALEYLSNDQVSDYAKKYFDSKAKAVDYLKSIGIEEKKEEGSEKVEEKVEQTLPIDETGRTKYWEKGGEQVKGSAWEEDPLIKEISTKANSVTWAELVKIIYEMTDEIKRRNMILHLRNAAKMMGDKARQDTDPDWVLYRKLLISLGVEI
ncbi:MAG: hypothetical protein UW68_C0028G0005 [Candidatus Collierbacteria bacterium GW2011_GWB1_44_6]|nr:MAG: hypothetical protein UW68_C0028G0005 [Candidatus Collierbacteria bacterium GW2011_GWB1_44_6]